MIINIERSPSLSLYYLGSEIINIIKNKEINYIEDIYYEIRHLLDQDIHIDFIYYSLDWLFLLSIIKLDNGRVVLCE